MNKKLMSKYFVSRQCYWPDGVLMVEIAIGGLDYSGSDMLVSKYKGEGREYTNPMAAASAAISVYNSWKTDCPDKDIGIDYGFTGGMGMPFEGTTVEKVMEWAEKENEKLPKCAGCSDGLGNETYSHEFSDEKFCSERCAEDDYYASIQDNESEELPEHF